MNIVKNEAQVPRWWETIGGQSLPTFIILVLAFPVVALLGVAIGALDPVYGAAAAGCMVMVLIILLRWDALAVAAIIAVHLYIDWYLGLHLVALLMALILLFAYYFVRTTDHPWIGPRSTWLWILFLILTIYPAINGGSLRPYDAATFYPGLVLGAFMMFWLGNIIAKDVSALRRVFQFLTVLAVLLSIHTIIQATTGVFLFVTSRGEAYLDALSNYQILGTNASRSGSFFGSPNGNATFLATAFFLSFGLFIESKQLCPKLLYFLEMLLILLALMLTYSNGAWIAVFGGILAFVILVGNTRYRMLLLVLIAVLVVAALTIFPSQIAVQLFRASGPNELALHMGSWQTAIRVIEAFPLSGVGLGGQAYLVRANPYRVPAQIVPLEAPDNSYLQWGAMAGIPVMIVFLLLLGRVFWFSWRNWRVIDPRYRPLLGGGITALITLSINSMSVDGWTSPTGLATLAWLIAGIVTSPLIGHWPHQQPTPPVDRTMETIPTQVEASRMDKAKRVRDMPDMSEYSIESTGKPTPAVEKTRRYCDTLATSAHAAGIYDVVTSELPVVEIVQLPTQIGERAIPVSSPPSLPTIDSTSITDQLTWKLP